MLFVFALIAIIINIYLFWPNKVKVYSENFFITEQNIENNNRIDKSWWHFLGKERKIEDEKEFNISLPDLELNNFDYILTGGRKILSLEYNKFGRLTSEFGWEKNIYNGRIYLSKDWQPNTLFLYKVEKNKIYDEGSSIKLK